MVVMESGENVDQLDEAENSQKENGRGNRKDDEKEKPLEELLQQGSWQLLQIAIVPEHEETDGDLFLLNDHAVVRGLQKLIDLGPQELIGLTIAMQRRIFTLAVQPWSDRRVHRRGKRAATRDW
jgi:hypothetical protein